MARFMVAPARVPMRMYDVPGSPPGAASTCKNFQTFQTLRKDHRTLPRCRHRPSCKQTLNRAMCCPPELDENEELDADADADADDLPLAVALAHELDEELVDPAIAALPPIVKTNKRQGNILTIFIMAISSLRA
jgi:hypothetical protein